MSSATSCGDYPQWLWEVCGRWRSIGGSPEVRIYFTGKRYFRVEFSYDSDTVFRRPIYHKWVYPCFYLYGRIKLSYDAGRGVLTLSDYGEYVRVEE